jgi:hypothetical protein
LTTASIPSASSIFLHTILKEMRNRKGSSHCFDFASEIPTRKDRYPSVPMLRAVCGTVQVTSSSASIDTGTRYISKADDSNRNDSDSRHNATADYSSSNLLDRTRGSRKHIA